LVILVYRNNEEIQMGGRTMRTFSVELFVEAEDDAIEGFIEKVVENCFDSYDGYVATNVSATLIDETKEDKQ
jgi:hypothetical protein